MYRKECYVFEGSKPVKAVVRNYTKDDFQALIQVQQESFPPPFPAELWWNEEQLTEHVTRFPQGALCVEIDGRICGSMTGLVVPLHNDKSHHTWEEITDNGYIRNHTPDGNTLYVVDICVSPAYRKFGLGKLLMQSMYEVVIEQKLDRLLGGGRIPGYHRHASSLTPEQYLDEVVKGTIQDPVITFLMRCGRSPVAVVHNYLEDDESHNCAVLMEWWNPFKKKQG